MVVRVYIELDRFYRIGKAREYGEVDMTGTVGCSPAVANSVTVQYRNGARLARFDLEQ